MKHYTEHKGFGNKLERFLKVKLGQRGVKR